MQGSAKQLTLPALLQRGSASPFAYTRQTHGASWQYEDHVWQSSSAVQLAADIVPVGVFDGPASAAAPGAATTPASATASRCAASFAGLLGLLLLQAARTKVNVAKKKMFSGAEGDRTPDLIHAMDALSQLSYGPER